jgi:AGZA family xanthine/uracil permease-like MFS transporter
VLPTPAIVPILLYIGLLIGAQAFQAVPARHAVAVVMAIIPNVAAWAQGQMDNVLAAAGTTAAKVGYANIAANGTIYKGLALLGGGAVLAGLVLGAIVAFLIDRQFFWAAGYSAGGAVLGFIGLIHGSKVGWNVGGQIALGYLFAAVIFLAFGLAVRRVPDASAVSEASAEPEASAPAPADVPAAAAEAVS